MKKALAKQKTVLKPGVRQSGDYGNLPIEIPKGRAIGGKISVAEGNHFAITLYGFGPHWEAEYSPDPSPQAPISLAEIQRIAGNKNFTDEHYADFCAALDLYDITYLPEIAHLVSQMCHESGGFRWSQELASGAAYEWRSDLGNTQKGDGKKFKGGGWLQTTGRYNYSRLAKSVGDLT